MSSKHKSGMYYVNLASKNGLDVQMGKGDHAKISGPAGRGYMIVPLKRELCNGTEYAIRRWFKLLGILAIVVAILALAIH